MKGPSGEIFSRKKFPEVIRRASSQNAEDICLGVIEAVTQFCGSAAQADDITLVVAKAR
ncbi:MAG: SpoIIE family protein phosphatase [Planctomycetota bacterium]